VTELFDDHRCLAGYRLRKDEDTVYDIDLEWGVGQWLCTCGDSTFRQRECKHCLGLRAALARDGRA
jgi:hypothetical protein